MDDKVLEKAIEMLKEWSSGSYQPGIWIKRILIFLVRLTMVLTRNGLISMADLKVILGHKE